MKRKESAIEEETWFELSEAAQYLGVHFTTLRRWANAGEIEHVRTPGGRRRFSRKALDQFISRRYQSVEKAMVQPAEERAVDYARHGVQALSSGENSWMSRLSLEQRGILRNTGHQLTALLLQYSSRQENGEAFLKEGMRIASEYSYICSSIGLSLTETVKIFLFFCRSIQDGIYETGFLGGRGDVEGKRLFQRTTHFFDELLLELVNQFPK